MVEETLITQLLEAISGSDVGVIVGVCLLIAVTILRGITRDNLAKPAADWVSASAALVAGVGVLLAAGRSWYESLLIGALVVPSARGVWELVGGLVKKASGKKDDDEADTDNE